MSSCIEDVWSCITGSPSFYLPFIGTPKLPGSLAPLTLPPPPPGTRKKNPDQVGAVGGSAVWCCMVVVRCDLMFLVMRRGVVRWWCDVVWYGVGAV